MLKQISLAAAISLVIPLVGFLVASWILNDLNATFEPANGNLVEDACSVLVKDLTGDNKTACQEIIYIDWMRTASVWSGIIAIGLLLTYLLTSLLAGTNRKIISIIFPLLVPFSTFVIAILIFVQGTILTYAAWQGEIHAIGQVHYVLIGGIALGAAFGGFKLLGSLIALKTKVVATVFGKQLDKDKNEDLWNFVGSLATSLGSRKPDNILVGLEPTFYVTSADIDLANEKRTLTGETLYLSLPLMRLFNKEELAAVVGHELGHFRGNDTAYSLKFAPVYAGLAKSLSSLDTEDGTGSMATLPAMAMLSAMFEIFTRNERKISRIREFEADRAGVSVSSNKALAVSLAKVAVFSSHWQEIRHNNLERLNSGKVAENLSEVFEDSAKYDVAHTELDDLIGTILATEITHPTDTHPSISDRYKNINYDASALTIKDLIEVGGSAKELLSSTLVEVEHELTLLEHHMMIALGCTDSLKEEYEDEDSSLLNIIYTLAASMISADGKIEQSEVMTAENIGRQLVPSFDEVEFRAICKNVEALPKFENIVDMLSNSFEQQQLQVIYDYLKDIANADGEISNEEKDLLIYTREKFKLEL